MALPKEVAAFKFEKQPTHGEKSKLCCWYALYHYADGNFMSQGSFKQQAAQFYANMLGMNLQDALALALDGNDPALAIHLKPAMKGTAHVMNLGNYHFYTVRQITVETQMYRTTGTLRVKEKQWWSFNSYNLDAPQPLLSLAKAPGTKIF